MAIKIDEDVVGLDPAKVEQGVVMPVLDANDEPRFKNGDKNKPMGVRVRSIRCSAVDALNIRLQKRTAAMNRGRRTADQTIANSEFLARNAAAMTAELINFSNDIAVQVPAEDDSYELLKQKQFEDLRDQIWEFGRNDRNYGAAGTGNGSAEGDSTSASPALAPSEG